MVSICYRLGGGAAGSDDKAGRDLRDTRPCGRRLASWSCRRRHVGWRVSSVLRGERSGGAICRWCERGSRARAGGRRYTGRRKSLQTRIPVDGGIVQNTATQDGSPDECTYKEVLKEELLVRVVVRDPTPSRRSASFGRRAESESTYQYPVGPKYGPRSAVCIAVGPIATTKATRNQPAMRSTQECSAESVRRRTNNNMKTCSESANDL